MEPSRNSPWNLKIDIVLNNRSDARVAVMVILLRHNCDCSEQCLISENDSSQVELRRHRDSSRRNPGQRRARVLQIRKWTGSNPSRLRLLPCRVRDRVCRQFRGKRRRDRRQVRERTRLVRTALRYRRQTLLLN